MPSQPSSGDDESMNHHHRNRLVATTCGLAVLAAGALLTTACGSAQPSTTSATAETSTPSLTYAAQGTHAVGYQVFTATGAQEQPLTLRAWYPARRPDDERPATITYTAPNKFDEQITPGAWSSKSVEGYRKKYHAESTNLSLTSVSLRPAAPQDGHDAVTQSI